MIISWGKFSAFRYVPSVRCMVSLKSARSWNSSDPSVDVSHRNRGSDCGAVAVRLDTIDLHRPRICTVVREGFLYTVQQKTAKASDTAWIRFKVTDELQAVISQCRDDIVSPYLVHRRPDRKKQQTRTKDHWTQEEERYLMRAFKAREAAECYKGWGNPGVP